MTAENVIAVSAVVVALVQVLKGAGVTGRWAIVAAALLSMLGVAIWGYSQDDFSRHAVWSYFAGWAAVLLSAAGAFGLVNGGAEAVTAMKGAPSALLKSLTGTGDGRNPKSDEKEGNP